MYNSINLWINKKIDNEKIFNILDKLFLNIISYLNHENINIKDIDIFKKNFYKFAYKYSN